MEDPYFAIIKGLAEPYTAASVLASLCAQQWNLGADQRDEFVILLHANYRFGGKLFRSRAGDDFVPNVPDGAIFFTSETINLYPPLIPTPPLTVDISGRPFAYLPGQYALFSVDLGAAKRPLSRMYTSQDVQKKAPSLGSCRRYLGQILKTVEQLEAYHEHVKESHIYAEGDHPFQVTSGIPLDYFYDKAFTNFNSPPETLIATLQRSDVGLLLTSPTTGNGKTHLLVAAAKEKYVSSVQAQAEAMSPHLARVVQAFEEVLHAEQPAIAKLMAHYHQKHSFPSLDEKPEKKKTPYDQLWLKIFGKPVEHMEFGTRPRVVGFLEETLTPLLQEAPVARIALVSFMDLEHMDQEGRKRVITTPHLYIDELLPADSKERAKLYGDLIYTRQRQGLPFSATANYSFEEIFAPCDAGERNRLISRAHDGICLEVRVEGEDYRRRRGNAQLRALGLMK